MKKYGWKWWAVGVFGGMAIITAVMVLALSISNTIDSILRGMC